MNCSRGPSSLRKGCAVTFFPVLLFPFSCLNPAQVKTTSSLLKGRARFQGSLIVFGLILAAANAPGADLGIFEGQEDIGRVSKPGGTSFGREDKAFLVSGGGENMWFTNDAFHFVWKKVSGDFALTAAIEFQGAGGNAHRKACLLVRQDLSPGSAYVDVALHGDGLTSLQFREAANGLTHEVQANRKGPRRATLKREGDTFFALLGSNATDMENAGTYVRLALKDPVYVGLGVCAHDNNALEKARFTEVSLEQNPKRSDTKPVLHCTLETIPIASRDRRAVYHTTDHIEAPNWSRDGGHFLFNSGGRIYQLPVAGGRPAAIETGFATKCNNDHGLSPDGAQLAISDQTKGGKSLIYTLAAAGGEPKLITPLGPSYWHGWSPDGSTLAYCAERDGEYDVYTIPATGGQEKRLTTAKGLDDGPDYSPDGKWIYFNSDRTGTMHIWRMKADGSDQEQLTSDDSNDWFPHPSPDGKWLVFVSFEKDVTGHPANKRVKLRMMSANGGPIQELANLFGGQGTINVPSMVTRQQTDRFRELRIALRMIAQFLHR